MFGNQQYLIAMKIQQEVEKLFIDLNVVTKELQLAYFEGKNYDINLLSNRGNQIVEQLAHYAQHLNQMSARA